MSGSASDATVAVALSGGIDSLVTGFLIKQAYKHVFGIHFTTGYETTPVDTAVLEAQLGIKVHTVDLSQAFEEKVVDYFVSTYLAGKTPNPCLVCNPEIKFGVLLDRALHLGADALATGHYATVINRFTCPDQDVSSPRLEKGADPKKDQSYFLSRLRAAQLDRLIFPLAATTKDEVRKIAGSHNLTPAVPSESQDICFIREHSFADFITRKRGIHPTPGNIVDMDGKVIGTHQGLHTFTVGQRRGINVPGPEPYYVRRINMADNTLEVCFKKNLARETMDVDDIVWNYSGTQDIMNLTVKIRYAHKGAKATLTLEENDRNDGSSASSGSSASVRFDTPQNAVTPGQAAAFYRGDRVLGAGIIR
ncbi:MAG TPA: tRNA 2-thiouridine(34) synthase MnmA [Desulfobacteraceae bacterium]|nr:tRNA 2-thiouridine(34) synthase MnmA [Desulfobacteraceae bacterium]